MEDDQQFCLRWNNHQSTLVAVFDTLLENGTLVDCTLAAEGKYLNAHKVVLSACSPYFESLLSQNYDKHPIFILKDVKYQELKAMMDYMYRGEVNISQDQLGALLKAAESLQIKGLSDNRKGETETKKTVAPPPPPPVSKSPPPSSASLPRVQGLTIEQRRREMEDSREGSQSPGARKRKRIRRRSLEDIENHHDASNSSESHHSSSHAPAQNIPTALSAVTAAPIKVAPPSTDVPEPVESKSEILTRHKPPAVVAAAAGDPEITQVPTKEKLETHSELMLEPKAEYIDEMNEDSIEDLTLDDDDISNMEQMDDSGAGPSHGNLGEASGQGFGGWHMGNQSQDEVFLAAQEAVGAHRDSQDTNHQLFNDNQDLINDHVMDINEERKPEIDVEDTVIFTPQILYSIDLDIDSPSSDISFPKNVPSSPHSTMSIDEGTLETDNVDVERSKKGMPEEMKVSEVPTTSMIFTPQITYSIDLDIESSSSDISLPKNNQAPSSDHSMRNIDWGNSETDNVDVEKPKNDMPEKMKRLEPTTLIIFTPQVTDSNDLEPPSGNISLPKNDHVPSSGHSIDEENSETDNVDVEKSKTDVPEKIQQSQKPTISNSVPKPTSSCQLDAENIAKQQNYVCKECGTQYQNLQELWQHQYAENHICHLPLQSYFMSVSNKDRLSCFGHSVTRIDDKTPQMNIIVSGKSESQTTIVISEASVSREQANVINSNNGHVCDVCSVNFSNNDELWRHQHTENHISSSTKIYHLHKMVSWIREHKNYMSVIDHIKIYCKICNQSFNCPDRELINDHINTQHHKLNEEKRNNYKKRGRRPSLHGKRFKCDKCDCNYKHMSSLNSHQKSQCGKEPQFVCDFNGCNYRAHLKGNMKLHMFTHKGKRNRALSCPRENCDYIGHFTREIKTHIRLVHGEKSSTS